MNHRKIWRRIGVAGLIAFSGVAVAADPPIQLTIDAPNAQGATGEALLMDRDWPLTFRAHIPGALYYISNRGDVRSPFGEKQFIVISDTDDCLDLRDYTDSPIPVPYQSCPHEFDEQVLEVYTERNDDAGQPDFSEMGLHGHRPCVDPIAGTLRDGSHNTVKLDLYDASSEMRLPGVKVGPRTDSPAGGVNDCYGYGADEDLPNLVVIADVGAARFYLPNFDRDPDKMYEIKNLAGFLSNVSVELVDGHDRTSVVATMLVRPGMFEPIVTFDRDIEDARYAGADFLRRVDGGPVEALQFPANRPPTLINALANEVPSKRVLVRAVLLKEPAPPVIKDTNRDGSVTINDLVASGYTLLSNEARAWIRTRAPSGLDDDGDRTPWDCPSPALLAADLDGSGSAGRFGCSTGSSNSKIPVPR